MGRLVSKMAAARCPGACPDDCDVVAHVRDILQLLCHYQWIYDVKITELFKERTWEKLPDDWFQYMCALSIDELGTLPECGQEGLPSCMTMPTSAGSCPKSLAQFITRCERLSLARGVDDVVAAKALPLRKDLTKGMNPKKEHEVSRMAGFVADLCQVLRCTAVVDAGAGLGYLGQCLSVQCGLNVYGIECVEERAQTAAARMEKITQGRKKMEYVGKVPVRGKSPLDQSEDCARMVEKDKSTNHLGFCTEKRRHVDEGPLDMSLLEDQKLHHVGELQEPPNISLSEDYVCAAVEASNCFSSDIPLLSKTRCHGDSDSITGNFSVVPLTIGNSDESLLQFEKLLETISSHGNDRVCLVGLHCCGDLTPAILRWFSQNVTPPCLKALIVVGCCYHKMADSQDVPGCSGSQFRNFPMSPAVQKCLEEVKRESPYFSINTLAMRLAAQETKARWGDQSVEDHTRHMKFLSYRAIMEVSLDRANISALRKIKWRAMKEKALSSFKSYVEDILLSYSLAGVGEDDIRIIKDIAMDTYQELAQNIPFVEAFTALQVCLQGPLESLLLLDRLLYLKATPLMTVQLVPLFPDLISPRNVALVGIRGGE